MGLEERVGHMSDDQLKMVGMVIGRPVGENIGSTVHITHRFLPNIGFFGDCAWSAS